MQADTREVLDLLGVEYDDNGQRLSFVCPLPDHADSRPSTCAWPEEGRFHCFGCEASGSIVDLYAGVRGMSTAEAAREIARLTGKAPPRSSEPDPAVERHVREVGEGVLKQTRGVLGMEAHFALGERLDKLCWAWRKGVVNEGQIRGGLDRFKREVTECLTS